MSAMSDPAPLPAGTAHTALQAMRCLLSRLRLRRDRDPTDPERWSSVTRDTRANEDTCIEVAEHALELLAKAARGHT